MDSGIQKGAEMARDMGNRSMKIGRRCTIDLTDAAAAEVDRIRATFDLSTADVFRYSLKLMSKYTDATKAGKEFAIIDPTKGDSRETLTLPLFQSIRQSDDDG